jgi:putative tryptophan/tyrosine transport system substrate-binding protein
MDRRVFVIGLGALLSASPVAEAQRKGKMPLVGFLDPHTPSIAAPFHEAFRRRLHELGYVEGQNIAIEYRFAEGQTERLPELAAELVRRDVDLIVAAATGVRAAQKATTAIPIVMVGYGGDPVRAGFVASLARPGGNITGSTLLFPDLSAKRLQLLLEAVPKVGRVAVLWNPITKAHDWREVQMAAPALGIELQSAEVKGPEHFERAFGEMRRGHADALLVLGDPLTFFHRKLIVELAAKNGLPAMYNEREYATASSNSDSRAIRAELDRRHAERMRPAARRISSASPWKSRKAQT